MLRILLFVNLIIASLLVVGPQSTKAIQIIDSIVTKRAPATTSSPDTYTGRQIIVGSGGGFAGSSTAYYLLDNGQLFGQRDHDTTYTFIGQQTTAATKRLFSSLENKCRIKSTRFNHPGNTYQFVRWRKGSQTYRVAWGATGQTVPAAYPKFYQSFIKLIPPTSPAN